MYVVILQVSIAHDDFPPEQVPDRYRVSKLLSEAKATHTTFDREIQLPFAPCQGLIVWVGEPGNLSDDEAVINQVIYNVGAKRFLCEVQPRITKGATFEQVVKEYLQSGWTWNADE